MPPPGKSIFYTIKRRLILGGLQAGNGLSPSTWFPEGIRLPVSGDRPVDVSPTVVRSRKGGKFVPLKRSVTRRDLARSGINPSGCLVRDSERPNVMMLVEGKPARTREGASPQTPSTP